MHLDVDSLAAAQLSTAARDAIEAAPAATLIVACAPSHVDVAAAVAATLAAAHPRHEVDHVAPERARWTIPDVETELVARARFAPDERRHVVVSDAHKATATVHDRLLKILEDGMVGTTVWLTHPAEAELPTALRGRAADQLALRAAPPAAMAAVLADRVADLTAHDAEVLLRQADGNLALAYAVAKFGMGEQLSIYAKPRSTQMPTSAALAMTLALAHLAVAQHHKTKKPPAAPAAKKGKLPTADLARLSPAARSTLRRMVDAVLARWEREIVEEIGTASPSRARELCDQFAGVRQVRDAAVFSTPVPTLLASALVAANT